VQQSKSLARDVLIAPLPDWLRTVLTASGGPRLHLPRPSANLRNRPTG
jgi:hypothetical protein